MPLIHIQTRIHAPIERCFDLARSMDFHKDCMVGHCEQAIAGVTAGLIGLNEEVTFRARHFGLWQCHSARITHFDSPHHFRDTMVKGTFQSFVHDHRFRSEGTETVMDDHVAFESPLGIFGRLTNGLFLKSYLTRLLAARARAIQSAAETEAWRNYI